jgi:alanyl aminopeptidase
MRSIALWAALAWSLSSSATATAASSAVIDEAPANARLPRGVEPTAQRLELELDPTQERYRGRVIIDISLDRPRQTIWLNARELDVDSAVVVAGDTMQAARFEITDPVEGFARLDVDTAIPAGTARLELSFSTRFRSDLEGLYRVSFEDRWYVFSQFEALSARQAFPCFDEPAFKIPFTVSVKHASGDRVVANTRRVRQEVHGDGITVFFAETKPLPTYLLAFVVGPIDIVQGRVLPPSAIRDHALSLRGLAPRGQGHLLTTSLERTAAVVLDQEQAFGLPYPYDKLDIVAVPDFGSGAMENAGLVTFRDTLLYVDDTSGISVQKANLSVIAHELAHQWFGNLVTMGFWDDLWLNEAFATWMASRTVERVRPDFDGAFELRETSAWAMGEDSLTSARQIREPIRNRGDINNAFDGITYSKGAAVIAMFEEWIDRERGQGTFLRGVSAYLNAHRHGTGTTADFLASVSQAAGFDVAGPFSTFLDQPGVPLVSVGCSVRNGRAGVDVAIERFLPIGSTGTAAARFALPVCVRPLDGTATDTTICQLIDRAGRIDLQRDRCPTALHGNADGAGYYRFTTSGPAMTAMSRALSTMTAGERLAFGQALVTSFERASIPFDELLTASVPLALDDELSVARTPWTLLRFARDHILDEASRARIHARVARVYQPAFDRLGLVDRSSDTPRDRERRAFIAGVLIQSDPAFARRLATLGRSWLKDRRERAADLERADGSTSRPSASPPLLAKDLIPQAIGAIVLVEVKDDAAFSALLSEAKAERDPRVRGYILNALASTQEAALHHRAADLLVDDALRVNEKAVALWIQGGQPQTSAAMFATVQARFDEFAGELPEDWRSSFPAAASGLCSDPEADAVNAFFGPKVQTTPGLDRSLAQTVEEIRLCAARVRAHAERAKAALR